MAKVKIVNKAVVTLHGLKPGGVKEIDVDCNGTPLDKNWRRRFRDAKIDGCVQVVKEAIKIKPKKEDKD